MPRLLAEHRPQKSRCCADDEEHQRGVPPQGIPPEYCLQGVAIDILLHDEADGLAKCANQQRDAQAIEQGFPRDRRNQNHDRTSGPGPRRNQQQGEYASHEFLPVVEGDHFHPVAADIGQYRSQIALNLENERKRICDDADQNNNRQPAADDQPLIAGVAVQLPCVVRRHHKGYHPQREIQQETILV